MDPQVAAALKQLILIGFKLPWKLPAGAASLLPTEPRARAQLVAQELAGGTFQGQEFEAVVNLFEKVLSGEQDLDAHIWAKLLGAARFEITTLKEQLHRFHSNP